MASFLSRLDIAVSGLVAQRLRTEVISQNIANAQTTRTEDGTPYRRQVTLFGEYRPYKNIDVTKRFEFGTVLNMTLEQRRERRLGGVRVLEVLEDPTPFTPVYDPSHPDADADGYYYLPNVDIAEEQEDFMAATRSYEANMTVLEGLIQMSNKALSIGR